ncbi:MAG TPA: hypothetical protein VFP47_19735 [Pyrinomonadaceae bacterium]|nr:hypothetical protein [Pyrinomonadaceae bacterium]
MECETLRDEVASCVLSNGLPTLGVLSQGLPMMSTQAIAIS